MKKFSLILFLMTSIVLGSYASEKKEKKEINAFELVDAKAFVFDARSLTSHKGFSKTLTSNYYLSIQGDSASAYLPYVGRAYAGAMGGDGPIAFDNEMLDYKVVLKEKKKAQNNQMIVTFKIKSKKDIFNCTLFVGVSGYSTLSVNPGNRQVVNFDGNVEPIKESE